MLLSWFIGVPQNGNILGTTTNFTDFGQPADGTQAPPVGMVATMTGTGALAGALNTPGMAATLAGLGTLSGSMNSSMVALMSGFGFLQGTISGGTAAGAGAKFRLFGVTIETVRSPSGSPIAAPIKLQ